MPDSVRVVGTTSSSSMQTTGCFPHAVATGIEWLAAHPDWAFVTGHVRLIDEAGSPTGIPPQEHADGNHYIELLRSNYIWTPGVVMYRRAVFDSARARSRQPPADRRTTS